MNINFKETVSELERNRKELVTLLGKIDAAIEAFSGLERLFPSPEKLQVLRKLPGAEVRTLEKPGVVDFCVSYIRQKGKEVSLNELFEAYHKAIGTKFLSSVHRTKIKNYFGITLNSHVKSAKNKRLKKSVFKLDGLGREVYYNVLSAVQLQTEKTTVGQEITSVKI